MWYLMFAYDPVIGFQVKKGVKVRICSNRCKFFTLKSRPPLRRDANMKMAELLPVRLTVPYFFDYRRGNFPFQNNPKDIDRSYKMDLDLQDCFGRENPIL